jgi:hypothetical protein
MIRAGSKLGSCSGVETGECRNPWTASPSRRDDVEVRLGLCDSIRKKLLALPAKQEGEPLSFSPALAFASPLRLGR